MLAPRGNVIRSVDLAMPTPERIRNRDKFVTFNTCCVEWGLRNFLGQLGDSVQARQESLGSLPEGDVWPDNWDIALRDEVSLVALVTNDVENEHSTDHKCCREKKAFLRLNSLPRH